MTTRTSTPPASISRRAFLANASMAALALQSRSLFSQTAAAPSVAPFIVHTPLGALRGESAGGVRIFRGVPFAEPPVGPLRFRAPLPLKQWSGERDATRFAASPMQWNESNAAGETPLTHSEDCLYLNLWAPEGKGPFPVFVWIHGGGYTSGHAFQTVFDGSEFARQGIVCITVEYRLGVFGFLDYGPLLDPKLDQKPDQKSDGKTAVTRFTAPYYGSGNNALRDIIAALEWTQQNVASFGGDPTRVTIGGESAGAKLSCILMGVPSAEPLFHQIISESGGAERVWLPEAAAAVANGFGDQWRRKTGLGLPTLLTSPADQLIAAQHEFLEQWAQHFPLRPEIDGRLVPLYPLKTIAAGSTRGKRLLIGTNRDESALFIGPQPKDVWSRDLGNLSLPKFQEVYRNYAKVYPQMTPEQLRIRAVTAEEYWIPSLRVAEAHLRGGGVTPGQTWMYRLDFTETSGRLAGFAYHSLDTGMVWDRPHLNAANLAAETTLSKQLHHAWVAFIRGEVPAAPGLPAWPEYSTTTRSTMVFDTQSRVDQQPHQAELHLWDGVL